MKKRILTILFTVCITSLNALTFSVDSSNKNYNLIYATGKVVRGDLYRLQSAYAQLPNKRKQSIVVFSSNGGELNEGLRIGKYLYRHGIGSAVMKNSICASSCALAFLGGRDKYGRKLLVLPRGSKLGFHSFYYNNRAYVSSDQIQQDLSNVLTYVNSIHMPVDLIIKMFKTNHNRMHWISRRNAYKLNIKTKLPGVRFAKRFDNNIQAQASNLPYSYASSKKSKLRYIKEYFSQINATIQSANGYYNNTALNSINGNYSYWLARTLSYISVRNIKVKHRNKVEAKVYYWLRNGVKVCSNNRYQLKRSYNGWEIATKKIVPCDRRSRNFINQLSYRLP